MNIYFCQSPWWHVTYLISFHPSRQCDYVGTIIHLIDAKWSSWRLADCPKVAQLISGRSGPELRSVSSGYVRGPGRGSKLTDPTKFPSGSPTQLLSVPRLGLAWPDLNMPVRETLDWFQTRRAPVQRWAQGKHIIKEKPNWALCTYSKSLESQKLELSLAETLIIIEKSFVWGVCMLWGVFLFLFFAFVRFILFLKHLFVAMLWNFHYLPNIYQYRVGIKVVPALTSGSRISIR